jgi:NitT/TauT family transport system substrate-binding protein
MERRTVLIGGIAALGCAGFAPVRAAALPEIRIGTLGFGTGNWDVDVARRHELDRAQGVSLTLVELAGKDGPVIALQAGAADVILGDWFWVSRQRVAGRDYVFAPHSATLGSVMVRPDAGIHTLADLKGKKFGVAGGPTDKSWLLLRCYCQRVLGHDLAELVEPAYGAPPLLSHLLLDGQLPAMLDYWPDAVTLRVNGIETLIAMSDVVLGLGVPKVPPMLGWVFSAAWAARNPKAVAGFLAAVRAAQSLLAQDDTEWPKLQKLTGASDDATLAGLRNAYRQGIVAPDDAAAKDAAATLFELVAKSGDTELTGGVPKLAAGTFWQSPAADPAQRPG